MESKKTACIIVSAGIGKRIGSKIPKQYLKLNGQPLIYHTIKSIINSHEFEKILVVINPEHESLFKESIGDTKNIEYVYGGKTRQESVKKGLEHLENKDIYKVLIHDAARPFISGEIIKNVINNIKENQAAVPALKINDTVKEVENNIAQSTIDRSKLYKIQTPQGFIYKEIFTLHKKLKNSEFTDDTSLFESEGKAVKIIDGTIENFKITTKEDLKRAEKNMQSQSNYNIKTGIGFDVHRLSDKNKDESKKLVLAGIEIPSDKFLLGHSDADVAIHAIVDAILGAIGQGDIGDHFPPTNDKFKNTNSEIFLKKSIDLMKQANSFITNIDFTIICEEPKISPYKKQMKENIARICNIEDKMINVKATTTEKIGFTGRKEGIASQAIVTIKEYIN